MDSTWKVTPGSVEKSLVVTIIMSNCYEICPVYVLIQQIQTTEMGYSLHTVHVTYLVT